MNTNKYLASYSIDQDNGFLPRQIPLDTLPSVYSEWEHLASGFSDLLNARRFRQAADSLPVLPAHELQTTAELERAMLLLSSFGHGYVWEGYVGVNHIPEGIAIPWDAVARKLNRRPSLAHASLVIQNWALIDDSKPIQVGNLKTQVQFHGGLDESWFYLITTEIEAKGASIIHSLGTLACDIDDVDQVVAEALLQRMHSGLVEIKISLLRMYENCDPYIFHTRVRPFLASLNNIEYRGCAENPRSYFGGSAAQSALLQSIDAAFGIEHLEPRTNQYLIEMRAYMPPDHARFVRDMEGLKVIPLLTTRFPALQDVVDACISELKEFRQIHLEMVARYIMGQTPKNGPGHVGTGGTNPMVFLKQVKNDTKGSRN